MVEFISTNQAAEIGKTVYSIGKEFIAGRKMNAVIGNIKSSIQEISDKTRRMGFKTAEAHLQSAIHSLNNIIYSKDAESEFRSAIHHLYDAYYVQNNVMDVYTFFDSCVFCGNTAAMICGMHEYLDESEIACEWLEKAKQSYEKAKGIYENSVEFHRGIIRGLAVIFPDAIRCYTEMSTRLVQGTPFQLFHIISPMQFAALGKQYTTSADFEVGIWKLKKKLFTVYFLSLEGEIKIKHLLSELNAIIENPMKRVCLIEGEKELPIQEN